LVGYNLKDGDELRISIKSYSQAVNSSNLIDNTIKQDTAILAAVALSSELGSMLFRAKYAGDEHSVMMLMDAWRIKVSAVAKKRRFLEKANEVADTSLRYWLQGVCRVCDGRTAPKIDNTPMLADLVCPACGGSGQARLKCDESIKDHVRDAIETLNQMEREAGGAAIRKLSDDVRAV